MRKGQGGIPTEILHRIQHIKRVIQVANSNLMIHFNAGYYYLKMLNVEIFVRYIFENKPKHYL